MSPRVPVTAGVASGVGGVAATRGGNACAVEP